MTTSHDHRLRIASAVLIIHAVLLVTAFFVLAASFEFPAVLREPPLRILELFRANQATVQATYYLFTMTGLTFIVMAIAVHEALRERSGSWGRFALVMGVLAGLTQAIGFIRWVWLVPTVAAIATDPSASPASRDAALVVFDSLHQFAGVSVGENLSFWFQGLWTIGIGVALLRRFDRRLGIIGIASGATFVLYTAEQFGGPMAWLGELNVLFHVAWVTWLVLVASLLLAMRRNPGVTRLGNRAFAIAAAGATALLAATLVGG